MEQMVLALYDREEDAERAVETLLKGGLGSELISVMTQQDELTDGDIPGRATKTRQRAVAGGVLAGSIGAALGGLVAGPLGLIGAGPLAGLLFGVGGAYGVVGGAITGQDENKERLERLHEKLTDGKVLVTVETSNLDKANDVEATLRRFGGQDTDIIR